MDGDDMLVLMEGSSGPDPHVTPKLDQTVQALTGVCMCSREL